MKILLKKSNDHDDHMQWSLKIRLLNAIMITTNVKSFVDTTTFYVFSPGFVISVAHLWVCHTLWVLMEFFINSFAQTMYDQLTLLGRVVVKSQFYTTWISALIFGTHCKVLHHFDMVQLQHHQSACRWMKIDWVSQLQMSARLQYIYVWQSNLNGIRAARSA